jgi:acetyl esterase/lipase
MSSIREIDFAQPEGFRSLSLDLRTPDAEAAPLVVFLHGGGWLRGGRKVFTPGISDAQSFDRIVAAGFAIASCEYRLSGEARFPAQLDDVNAALAWLRASGAEYGVDASRIVLWGVSVGATLAALAGLRRDDIRGVVDWFGPADLFAMAEHDSVVHNREALAAALHGVGADVELHPLEGGGHFWHGLHNTDPVFDAAIDFARRVTAH